MKRVFDCNIKLTIKVQNNNKKIEMVCSIHTNIHELKIQISKLLDLVIFDTEMDLYYQSNRPMKPISTLLQNGIQRNTQITAIITRMKQNKPLDVQGSKKKPMNIDDKVTTFGLSLLCACSNQKCLNFEEGIWITLGCGRFPLQHTISQIKCNLCPQRIKSIKKTMNCRQIKVSKCVYEISGSQNDRKGLSVPRKQPFKKAIKEVDIKKIIDNWSWNEDLTLTIKNL